MQTFESLVGKRVEVDTLHCPAFCIKITEVDAETVSGTDDEGVTWMIRRTSIARWRECPRKTIGVRR